MTMREKITEFSFLGKEQFFYNVHSKTVMPKLQLLISLFSVLF